MQGPQKSQFNSLVLNWKDNESYVNAPKINFNYKTSRACVVSFVRYRKNQSIQNASHNTNYHQELFPASFEKSRQLTIETLLADNQRCMSKYLLLLLLLDQELTTVDCLFIAFLDGERNRCSHSTTTLLLLLL